MSYTLAHDYLCIS